MNTVTTNDITSRSNLDGSHDDYTYGNEGRLSGVTTKSSGGTTTGFRLYCYDGNGNRTSTSATIGQACPGGSTFSYDGANQQTGTPRQKVTILIRVQAADGVIRIGRGVLAYMSDRLGRR